MANEQTPAASSQDQMQGQLNILKTYVKDLSVENPGSPQVFQQNKMPEVEMNLRTKANKVGDDLYESILTVTLTFKLEDKIVLLVEAQQAGVFNISGVPEEILQRVIAINCPTILLPFAREVVASCVGGAGFPPFYIPPTNFEALYLQQQQAQAQKNGAPNSDAKH